MEHKRKHTPEIGKEPVLLYSPAEMDEMLKKIDALGIGMDPVIEDMTFAQIDKLLNGVPN